MRSSIALVALHEGYDLTLFVKSFSKFLNHSQTCQVLSSQTIFPRNREVAQAAPNSLFEKSLLLAVDSFKTKKDIIIYLTDNSLSNWSKRSLREVDTIWIVGQHENKAELTPIAKELMYQDNSQKASLIVKFANKTIENEEANHWLVPKNINHFYSISRNNITDLEQLVQTCLNLNQKTSLIKRGVA